MGSDVMGCTWLARRGRVGPAAWPSTVLRGRHASSRGDLSDVYLSLVWWGVAWLFRVTDGVKIGYKYALGRYVVMGYCGALVVPPSAGTVPCEAICNDEKPQPTALLPPRCPSRMISFSALRFLFVAALRSWLCQSTFAGQLGRLPHGADLHIPTTPAALP